MYLQDPFINATAPFQPLFSSIYHYYYEVYLDLSFEPSSDHHAIIFVPLCLISEVLCNLSSPFKCLTKRVGFLQLFMRPVIILSVAKYQGYTGVIPLVALQPAARDLCFFLLSLVFFFLFLRVCVFGLLFFLSLRK